MAVTDPNAVERVAVIGAGTIGASWAALFLARGLAVGAYDPAPGAEAFLRGFVARAWPSLLALGLTEAARPPRVDFSTSLEQALAGAQFVQENAPEDEALKAGLIARIDAALPPDVVIASSSSAFLVSDLQRGCRHPGRVVLGHPFNPPHLVPLVELAGGAASDPAALDWTMAFYAAIGQRPVRLKREIYRHVANRLQSVLWNEAVRLVEEGVADPAEIDRAVVEGPGLRWALMGPFLSHHLGGGSGGLAKALTMLGDPQAGADGRARRMPLSDDLKRRLLDDLEAVTGGRDIEALEARRDRGLVAIRKARDVL
jgi:3-hydroxyacyl-CoA dehydrogenase